MSPSTDRLTIVSAALLGFMILLLLLARFLLTAKEFKRTMRYIEREINRTQGRDEILETPKTSFVAFSAPFYSA